MSDPSIQKPRRLEDATAVYLADIETQFNELCKRPQDEDTAENKAILVNNVFQEIHARTASAACDRRTNFILEQLCFEADFTVLVSLLESWTVYAVFMARNRYASHVTQAIISKLLYILKRENPPEKDLQRVYAAVVSFTTPILQEISWLGKEMSASHVIRSSISLVLGLPIIAEKKGKKSKHQHSIGYAESLESLYEEGHFHVSNKNTYPMPAFVKEVLVAALDKLLHKSGVDLQQLIAEISSCAIMTLLVRIISNPSFIPNSVQYLDKLVEKVMYLPNITSQSFFPSHDTKAFDLFYAMAGDKMGSYFLETLFEACPTHVFVNLVQEYRLHSSSDGLVEYVKDAHGNFLIQAILKRIAADIKHSADVREIGMVMIDNLLGMKEEDFVELLGSRIMVFYWLAELCNALDSSTFISILFDKVLSVWSNGNIEDLDSASVYLAAKLTTQPRDTGEKESKGADDFKPMDSYGVNLAKVIGSFIRSSQVGEKMKRIICLLSIESLKHVATTGALSKAIFDSFLSYSNTVENKLLGQKLISIAYELAMHFAGQHVLKKVYQTSDVRGKEKWITTLLTRKNDLQRSKEGRNALHAMSAELYERDVSGWKSEMKKQAREQARATGEIGRTTESQPSKEEKRSGEYEDAGKEEEALEQGEGKRKRKRRRASSKKEATET